jgi:radical SAM protein with 4Fe4S-binding SPASM domain
VSTREPGRIRIEDCEQQNDGPDHGAPAAPASRARKKVSPTRAVFRLLEFVLGQGTFGPVRLLAQDSLRVLMHRLSRIRATAASMLEMDLTPPLPVRLQVETVDVCNLKCRMCTREQLTDMNTRIMPLDEFAVLVKDIQPFYVTLNGLGEPLLDKTIFDKLALLHSQGIMSSMPTNGTYIKGNKRALLARNMPDVLQLSIDGATQETFEYIRADSDFESILRNYRAIVSMSRTGNTRGGTSIRILCALQRKNLQEFREMYSLVRTMPGIASFELVPVFDYDPAGGAFRDLIPSAAEVAAVHAELDSAMAATDVREERAFYQRWKNVSAAWSVPAANEDPTAAGGEHGCLVPWFNAYVDAKGRVYPCCYLTTSDHVMGNVRTEAFAKIWHGERYQQFRKRLITDRPNLDGCRTCPRNDDSRLRFLGRVRPLLH